MSIYLDRNSRVLVQGITGREGTFHSEQMLAYGTRIVGGVTPGKGGATIAGMPVFDTMREAVGRTDATHSIVFVPPAGAADAIFEAYDAGITTCVCITDGVAVGDMIDIVAATKPMRLIGPNCPGVLSAGRASLGIMPGHVFTPGNVGVISRSGTLTYEIVAALTAAGLGQSTCVGIGGDPIVGTRFVDVLEAFAADPETTSIVICGEIGDSDEEAAATYVADHLAHVPVVAFIGGRSAPEGTRLGHAGAIVSGNLGTAASKLAAFAHAGVPVAERLSEIPSLLTAKSGIHRLNAD